VADVPKFKDFKLEAPKAPKTEEKFAVTPNTTTTTPPPIQPAKEIHIDVNDGSLSPAVLHLIQSNNMDPKTIVGTGPRGRILKGDVLDHLEKRVVAQPTTPAPVAKPAPIPPSSKGKFEDIPNNNIRKVIAQRLTESKTTIPHLYSSRDCEIDALLKIRAKINGLNKDLKLSVNDFLIKATGLALHDVPELNASYTPTAIRRYHSVDISIAVATDKGLITPIIFQAHTKGLATIAKETKDLAARGREGKLKPQEFQGGTFSISNLGMFGVREFSAVINPPQGGILAVGGPQKRVVLGSDDKPKVVTIINVTLSVDGRVADEEATSKFLDRLSIYLTTPENLLL